MSSLARLHPERRVWGRWNGQCNASDLQSVPVPVQRRHECNQGRLSAATRTSDGQRPRGSRESVGSGEARAGREQGVSGGRDGMKRSRRSVSRVHCRAGTRPTKKASELMEMADEVRRELGEA